MELQGKDKRTTNDTGSISESAITTRFLQLGYTVYFPYGGKQRYDMVIENDEGQIWRVQCKTAQMQNNGTIIVFHTASHNVALKDKRMRHYRGQCDFFAAYCEELNKVYLLPVDQVGTARAKLRLASAKNNQEEKVRWAKDYEL